MTGQLNRGQQPTEQRQWEKKVSNRWANGGHEEGGKSAQVRGRGKKAKEGREAGDIIQ